MENSDYEGILSTTSSLTEEEEEDDELPNFVLFSING